MLIPNSARFMFPDIVRHQRLADLSGVQVLAGLSVFTRAPFSNMAACTQLWQTRASSRSHSATDYAGHKRRGMTPLKCTSLRFRNACTSLVDHNPFFATTALLLDGANAQMTQEWKRSQRRIQQAVSSASSQWNYWRNRSCQHRLPRRTTRVVPEEKIETQRA